VFITRGLLISLEGIDGCGKSTQAELLKNKLEQQGFPLIAVREPGGTPVGENIRQVLLQNNYNLTLHTELLLYMAARAELAEQVIIPALINGKIVLCDRFTDSTLAYQGYGGGSDLWWIRLLNCRAAGGALPDLTFLLDLTVEEAAARRGSAPDRMESQDYYYHSRVRSGYLEIARRERHRVKVIDASTEAEQQAEEIWQAVRRLLEKRTETRGGYEF